MYILFCKTFRGQLNFISTDLISLYTESFQESDYFIDQWPIDGNREHKALLYCTYPRLLQKLSEYVYPKETGWSC